MRTPGPDLTRRSLLRAGLGAGVASAVLSGLTACSGRSTSGPSKAPPPGPGDARRVVYGPDHDDQFADLRLPTRAALGTVALLHGGYWFPQYGLDLLAPMARRLTTLGYATWNVEYRRTGQGGGWPQTFTDVALATDRLAQEKVPAQVVVIGHSAGGHLAGWLASRTARTPGGGPRVVPRAVLSLSGVLDLTTAASAPESSGPVRAFMGGTPQQHPDRYRLGDPTLLVPAACPVFAAQATQEQVIPVDQAAAYVARARAAGGTATRVDLEGDHFSISSPDSPSFATVQRLLQRSFSSGR